MGNNYAAAESTDKYNIQCIEYSKSLDNGGSGNSMELPGLANLESFIKVDKTVTPATRRILGLQMGKKGGIFKRNSQSSPAVDGGLDYHEILHGNLEIIAIRSKTQKL